VPIGTPLYSSQKGRFKTPLFLPWSVSETARTTFSLSALWRSSLSSFFLQSCDSGALTGRWCFSFPPHCGASGPSLFHASYDSRANPKASRSIFFPAGTQMVKAPAPSSLPFLAHSPIYPSKDISYVFKPGTSACSYPDQLFSSRTKW